jgi:hypothetical protein
VGGASGEVIPLRALLRQVKAQVLSNFNDRASSLQVVEVIEDRVFLFPLGGLVPFDDFALRLDLYRLKGGLLFGRGFSGEGFEKSHVDDDRLAGEGFKVASPVGAARRRFALLGDRPVKLSDSIRVEELNVDVNPSPFEAGGHGAQDVANELARLVVIVEVDSIQKVRPVP